MLATRMGECSLFPLLEANFQKWQAMSWLQSGHHVSNFFHMVGVSVSVRYIMVQDIILSIALEKELHVLNCM